MFDEKLPIPELPDEKMFISLLTAFDAITGVKVFPFLFTVLFLKPQSKHIS
jgi:hypothetical protein